MKVSIDGDDTFGAVSGLGLGPGTTSLPVPGGELVNGPTEAFAPIPHLLDVFQIQQIGTLVLRLEAAAAAICQPVPAVQGLSSSASGSLTPRTPSTSRKRHRGLQLQHPRVTLDPSSSDEELFLLLGSFVYRIEHLLSSLTLHQLGPMAPALAALSSAVKIDSTTLLKALSVFAQSMSTTR